MHVLDTGIRGLRGELSRTLPGVSKTISSLHKTDAIAINRRTEGALRRRKRGVYQGVTSEVRQRYTELTKHLSTGSHILVSTATF